MPVKTIRLNLTAAYIPLCVSFSGQQTAVRSVEDTNYVITNAYSGEGADKDLGIPMVIYGENILPTIQGMQSVSYKEEVLANQLRPSETRFDRAIILRDKNETRYLFSPGNGTNLVLKNKTWLEFPFPVRNSGMVTHAYSNQRTFIFYANTAAYEYKLGGVNGTFSRVPLKGLEVQNITGITNANNYLIAWDSKRIYYSSAIDPTDFVPSLSSGAGSEFVTKVRGAIVCCLPTSDGFIIYTTANAVLATYTDNIRFPWRYKEIEGSAGINKPEHVSFDANYSGHFVWTESGLMMYLKDKASIIFPEITDFIANKLVEEYIGDTGKQNHQNETAVFASETQDFSSKPYGDNGIVEYHLLNQAHVKVTFLGSRYFAFSYGYRTKYLDWVIVYDFGLRRFGKLKIRHTDCFHSIPTPGSDLVPKDIFGFLQPDGRVVNIDFSDMKQDTGVLLLGRIQHTRGQLLEINSVELSSTRPSDTAIQLLPSNDGKNFMPAEFPQEVIKERNYTRWHSRVTAKNFALVIRGTYSLVDALIDVIVKGKK
jgi:hypothetical protein